jgi:hypothetical protein
VLDSADCAASFPTIPEVLPERRTAGKDRNIAAVGKNNKIALLMRELEKAPQSS